MIPHSSPEISQTDINHVSHVLTSGMIAQGSVVREFEEAVGSYIGVPHAVATSSGTAALVLALRALEIGPGQEVIIPTYVCRSVLEAVLSVGAEPRLCDVDDDWTISANSAAAQRSIATAAIIVPYIFGITKDLAALQSIGVPLIEDCCQSFGAMTPRGRTGSFGLISFFSFHATKCLTTGEGGMSCTGDAELGRRMLELRDGAAGALRGRVPCAMSDLQAALGLSQLRRYDSFLARRRTLADVYFEALTPEPSVTAPELTRGRSIHFRFPVRVAADIDKWIRAFATSQIAVRRGVDDLLHRQLALPDAGFPSAVRLFDTTLSLPIYPALTDAQQAHIVARLREVSAC